MKPSKRVAQEVSPMLTEFGNDITLNEQLFARIQKIYAQKSDLDLKRRAIYPLRKKI